MHKKPPSLKRTRPEEKEIPAPPPRKKGRKLRILVAAAMCCVLVR